MTITSLMKTTVAVGLLFLSGCDAARGMRDDWARLTSSQPTAQKPAPRPASVAPRPRPTAVAAANSTAHPARDTPAAPAVALSVEPPTAGTPAAAPQIALAGKSEGEVRAMLGNPTSEQDRPPGKQWRYRDGQCTLDVQLYPDVQTKQFGTLAYEVKSDDNTDQGKRLCVAQLQSRVHSRSH